jgi:hypothetical protein
LGFDYRKGENDFSLIHRVLIGSGAQISSYTVDIESFSAGLKRHGRESDHSPFESNAEVKKWWNDISTPPVEPIV